ADVTDAGAPACESLVWQPATAPRSPSDASSLPERTTVKLDRFAMGPPLTSTATAPTAGPSMVSLMTPSVSRATPRCGRGTTPEQRDIFPRRTRWDGDRNLTTDEPPGIRSRTSSAARV